MTKLKKILQYIIIVSRGVPPIIYYTIRYTNRFAKHPEKWPLEYRYKIVRKYITKVVKACFTKINLFDFENFANFEGQALFICNHLSDADPLLLIALSEKPLCFVAKKEILDFPFVGKVMRSIDCYPLDRQNLMNQVNTIKKVVRHLQNPNSSRLIIFPEGTRNRHPQNPCLEYKAGTIKIASMANVPIVNISLFGSSRLFTIKSFLHHYPIFFHFSKPLSVEETKGLNSAQLADKLKKETDAKVNEFRELDKNFVYNSHVSKKQKALETIIDMRTNS